MLTQRLAGKIKALGRNKRNKQNLNEILLSNIEFPNQQHSKITKKFEERRLNKVLYKVAWMIQPVHNLKTEKRQTDPFDTGFPLGHVVQNCAPGIAMQKLY